MAKLEKLACVSCGAMLDVDIDMTVLTCAFCGTRLVLEQATDGILKTGLLPRKQHAEVEQWFRRIGVTCSLGPPELTCTLDLSGKSIDTADMRYFLYFPDLVFLNLQDTTITDDHLSGLRHLTHLKHLYLGNTAISDLSFTARMGSLETLDLGKTRVQDAGLLHLEGMANLRLLDLEDTDITDSGMRNICKIRSLEQLDISGTLVTVEGLKLLKGNGKYKKLDYSESINDIDMLRADIIELCEVKSVIAFIGEGITDEDLRKLEVLTHIKTLYLNGNRITDAGLEIISKHRHLEELDLSGNTITDKGLSHLTGMKRLRSLDLRSTEVSGRGVKILGESLPSARIYS